MPGIDIISDELLETFYCFFEWVYDVELTEGQADSIYLVLRDGWTNGDDSERSLLAAVLKAQDKLKAASPSEHEALRKRAQENLRDEFGTRAVNDKGRLLDALYDAIEEQSPGAIGVERSRRLGKPDPTRPVSRVKEKPRRSGPVPPPTERRSPKRSAGVIERSTPARPPPPAPTPAAEPPGPAKTPLPIKPEMGYLPAAQQAMAMAEYFGKLAQAHMANGDLHEAKLASANQEQYSAMAKTMTDAEHRMIMNIWR